MNKGFFNEKEDLLEKLNIDNSHIDVMQYLHGKCDEFALALNKALGYKIVIWTDYIDDEPVLVHAFNSIECEDKLYYIDVRGITDNLDDITSSFDYCEDPELKHLSYNEAKEILSGILDMDIEISAEIHKIIHTYAANYSL